MNYLIDEGVNIGKGANCTISMLHHFLSTHAFGEVSLNLHADNCSGQNKNRFVMQYLAWRVMAGFNQRAEISFMLVGHTKFSPDWCFGLVKQRFRRTKVGCLDDIVKVVNDSSKVNFAQLVGREDGTIIVHQYNWADFFSTFFKRNAFAGIKSWQHLVFSAEKPGVALVRNATDGKETKLSLLSADNIHWKPKPSDMPPEIKPEGLSRERKTYLFEKIREFCPSYCRDIVCPDPNAPSSSLTPHPHSTGFPGGLDFESPHVETSHPGPPATKRRRNKA